jgi:hypothetical protein
MKSANEIINECCDECTSLNNFCYGCRIDMELLENKIDDVFSQYGTTIQELEAEIVTLKAMKGV